MMRRAVHALSHLLLNRYDRYRVLQRLAAEQGIAGFVVPGENGVVEGRADDLAVLRSYAWTGRWARETNRRISAFLDGGGTYLDIGANIGLTTIPIARNPAVVAHAFEPDPETFAALKANVARNGVQANVTLHNVALGDRAGTLTIERAPDNAGDIRVRADHGPDRDGAGGWSAVEVPAHRLDDLALAIEPPLGVKIDTQGAEGLVIAGGETVLAQAGLIALEFWPYRLAQMGDGEAAIAFLRKTFREGTLATGDRGEAGAAMPIAALADRLTTLLAEERDDEAAYYDVIAWT